MARKKTAFKFENNTDKIIVKIQEKPMKVLNIIGANLTREIRSNIRSSGSSRRGLLASSLGFWARKKEKDLQIGFKMSIIENVQKVGPGIVGKMIRFEEEDPIKPVVYKNRDLIQSMIAQAIDEIRKERT